MRKLLILFIMIFILTTPVKAAEFTAPDVPKGVEDLMPVETETFADGLWKIVKSAIGKLQPDLKDGMGICLSIIAVSMLVSILKQLPGNSSSVVEIAGVFVICLLLLNSAGTMIRLGADTIKELSEYGKLLLPVMTGAMAATGATVTSAALYTGTAVFDAVLSALIAKLLVPMVYGFLVLSIAAAVTGESMIKKLKDGLSGVMSWSLKTVVYIFTGYMGITGVISGSTDAAALKAAKLTIAGAVPMVGGILSEASDAVLVGAGLAKSAVGVYGLWAIAAIWISPFLKLGVQYLLLKLTGAICKTFDCKAITDVVGAFTAAMGILLGMTGAVCFLLLVSVVCFMRGIG